MRDDFDGLRRALESSVERRSFDTVAERADGVRRRRRTRSVVLASCAAVAAIVGASVAVTTTSEREPESPRYATSPTVTAQTTDGPPGGRNLAKDLTLVVRESWGDRLTLAIPTDVLGSANRVRVHLRSIDSRHADVRYTLVRDRAWAFEGKSWRPTSTCPGASLVALGDRGHLSLPKACVPAELRTRTKWTVRADGSPGAVGTTVRSFVGDAGPEHAN